MIVWRCHHSGVGMFVLDSRDCRDLLDITRKQSRNSNFSETST